MQVGDLVRYTDTYDIRDIGVGAIGLILGVPNRKEGYYHVLIGGKDYVLAFHHIEEIKCK